MDKQREKLVKLMNEADGECLNVGCTTCVFLREDDCCDQRIADHILADGWIRPPCKVGQTVYCIRYDIKRKPFIKPLEVLTITIYANGRFTVITTKEDIWGKTVFLTKEDAEKALKGVE